MAPRVQYVKHRLVHYNVTTRPSSAWTRQQLREAIGLEERYKFLNFCGRQATANTAAKAEVAVCHRKCASVRPR
jgi:hypothetical protein